MPAALARSGLLGVKLPLWLVDTVLGFLLLSPMASMDWLRLRMTLCGRRGGSEGGMGFLGFLPLGNLWDTCIWPLATNAILGDPWLKHQLLRVSHKRQANRAAGFECVTSKLGIIRRADSTEQVRGWLCSPGVLQDPLRVPSPPTAARSYAFPHRLCCLRSTL